MLSHKLIKIVSSRSYRRMQNSAQTNTYMRSRNVVLPIKLIGTLYFASNRIVSSRKRRLPSNRPRSRNPS